MKKRSRRKSRPQRTISEIEETAKSLGLDVCGVCRDAGCQLVGIQPSDICISLVQCQDPKGRKICDCIVISVVNGGICAFVVELKSGRYNLGRVKSKLETCGELLLDSLLTASQASKVRFFPVILSPHHPKRESRFAFAYKVRVRGKSRSFWFERCGISLQTLKEKCTSGT